MNNILFLLIALFVIINVIQTWLIFTYKLLIKGGIMIGAMEMIEIPLIIYLIIKGGVTGFLIIVFVETIQWMTIAYLTLKN
ncbi:hypothetical protein ACFL0A_00230 [Patescibacteria group bacterium]